MDNKQKALKSPLSAKCSECGQPCKEGNKYCGKVACRVQAHFRRKIDTNIFRLEMKAKIAGDGQKSVAKEVLSNIKSMQSDLQKAVDIIIAQEIKLIDLKKFLNNFLKNKE